MYIDAQEKAGKIVVWTRSKSGLLEFFEEDAPYYLYRKKDDGQYKTIFGYQVEKVNFDSRDEYYDYAKKHRTEVFESDISAVQKFLSDNFYHVDGPVHRGYFDIEVDFDLTNNRGYPSPDNPFGAVNSISLFDVARNEYHMFMLTNQKMELMDSVQGLRVVNHCCVTEKQLLDTFAREIENIDVISAWNGDRFDIPYLINRSEILYGRKKAREKFCRNGFSCTFRDYTSEYGTDEVRFGLVGRTHLDMMEVYKKFTRNTRGEMSSYRLDVIAERELNMHKREYRGDLGALYRNNPKEFFEYSLHDSRLLKMLDDKVKFISQAISMARRATIRFDEVLGSIKYLEMSIRNHCHFDRDEVLILPDRTENARGEFEGAFVMEPAIGVHGWSQSIDLGSLYPNTICALNISPETHVMQCDGYHEDFLKIVQCTDELVTMYEMSTHEKITMTAKEVHAYLRKNNYTISAYGSIFDNNRIGIIPEVLNIWKKQRRKMKNDGIKARKEGNVVFADYCDLTQDILKVGLNSLYGSIANPFSRFYTLYCAASTTLTGQEIGKYQAYCADKFIESSL